MPNMCEDNMLLNNHCLSYKTVQEINSDDKNGRRKKEVRRRCVVTRIEGYPEEMVRFTISPEGFIVPDLDKCLPGRGIWLSAQRNVIEEACTRGVFGRVSGRRVHVPSDLLIQIESGLWRRMIELIGLARRAGQAVSGFVKVREWVMQRRVGVVLHALEGSKEELERLVSGGENIPVIRELTSLDLSGVFGRDRVVNGALAVGRLATRLQQESKRFIAVSQMS